MEIYKLGRCHTRYNTRRAVIKPTFFKKKYIFPHGTAPPTRCEKRPFLFLVSQRTALSSKMTFIYMPREVEWERSCKTKRNAVSALAGFLPVKTFHLIARFLTHTNVTRIGWFESIECKRPFNPEGTLQNFSSHPWISWRTRYSTTNYSSSSGSELRQHLDRHFRTQFWKINLTITCSKCCACPEIWP